LALFGKKVNFVFMTENTKIIGVILAGGRGSRMGGVNKAEISLAGRRLVDIAVQRLSHQVDQIILSAPEDFGVNLPFAADENEKIRGPLAGLLAALKWGRRNIGGPFSVITAAVDTPFFPDDLVERLMAGDGPALAATGGMAQTTFGYWPDTIEPALKAYLLVADNPSIQGFRREHQVELINFANADDFLNINTPEDLKKAHKVAEEKT